MKGRNETVNWKLVLIPVAALSVAFAAGTKFFFGDGQTTKNTTAETIDFGADRAGEPEELATRKISVSPGAQGSSLEMFQEVNKDYTSYTGKKPGTAAAKPPESSPGAAAADGVDPYEQYARAQTGDLEAPGIPDLPKEPAPWMKGAPGTGSPGDPALSLKTAVTAAGPESRKALASSRNFGRAGFTSGSGQAMGRDRMGSGGSADFGRGSGQRGTANTVSNTNFSSPGSDGEGGGDGLYSEGGASSSGGSSSQSGESGGSKSGGELTTQQQEKPFPFLAVWPNQVNFGKLRMHETAYRAISVTNTGSAALKIRKVDNLDPDAPFGLADNNCNGKTLKPGESCSFRVKFNPKSIKGEFISGFEVETDDTENNYYNGLVEVKGGSAYNYWAYLLHHYKLAGTLGKADFGQMSAGASSTQNIYVMNTTSHKWRDIKLDKKGLPSAYSITSETCSGKAFGAWGYCRITVKFTPTDANVGRLNRNYGKYNTYNMNTKAKGVSASPRYPEVIESLNFSKPDGTIRLIANKGILKVKTTVAIASVKGEACAKFPVKGALRSGIYWYFR
ncbi:MAG: hypothetical protein FD189_1193 [Elusimicrobia bacterium]|nr:MAG: hypothetical protein FD154_1647 [Elusimicrobiota bacterium]KAF0155945.1 MAG: hypothetical protein FD189_1193 [Elusimicrobiota bacterium]